jgi:hypothetical protein
MAERVRIQVEQVSYCVWVMGLQMAELVGYSVEKDFLVVEMLG